MVSRKIQAVRVASIGAGAAMGCGKLAIVTTKKIQEESIIEENQEKLIQLKGSGVIKSIIGEQKSWGSC